MNITSDREERFKQTIAKRQFDLTVVLENVHDPHNIGAVLRTCDSIGIAEVYIVYSDPRIDIGNIEIGKNSSSGAVKWIDVHFSTDLDDTFKKVKTKYKNIYATHLSEDAVSLYDLELSQSAALVFGNESVGLSKEALAYCDGNFVIPQHGFVKSLNISVACAISLYECQRQRLRDSKYTNTFDDNNELHTAMFEKYELAQRSFRREEKMRRAKNYLKSDK